MIANDRRRSVLLALCVGAFAVRVITTCVLPNVAHPDETFQYLEQAYRLATGRGMVPWEYAVGARSWILPGLITPEIKAGVALSSAPVVRLWCVTLFMIAIATAGVAAAFALGARAGGLTHAFLAGFLAAFWCEFVYLSPHVLADTLAAVPLIAALAVSYRIEAPSVRRMVWAGTLFGLAFIVRVQLAPAIAVAMLVLCGREIRSRVLPMGFGFAGPLLLIGIVDWATLGMPFGSILIYIRVNAAGIADIFGQSPADVYFANEARIWSLATPLILITAGFGARKLPLLAWIAGLIVLTFSLVGHKEYRFIYPALPLLFVLCGVGTADILERLARRSGRSAAASPVPVAAAASAIWLLASATSGTQHAMRDRWRQDRDWLDAMRLIDADPAACGVGLDPSRAWSHTGLVRLRSDLRLYETAEAPGPAAYNYRLARQQPGIDAGQTTGAFQLVNCFGETQKICVYKRGGRCDSSNGWPLQAKPRDSVRDLLRGLASKP